MGLAEVVQQTGKTPLGSANKAACVNVIGLASDPIDFNKRAEKALSEAEFDMLELEDVEAFSDRMNTHEVDPDLRELAQEAEMDGQVKFGTFHTYPLKSRSPSKKRNPAHPEQPDAVQ